MQYAQFICTMPGQSLYGFPLDVPLPNASLTVYLAGTTTKATLYLKDGTTPLGNPFSADINGIGKFSAADGIYDVLIQSADLSFSAPLIESFQMFDFSDLNGISNLSALGTTGIIVRTGATAGVSDYVSRAIAGTSGKVVVTNGDGVAGAPTISIPGGAISNTELASGAAVANIGFTPENVANKSTDGTFAANSDTLYPSQKAVKTAIATAQAAAATTALSGNFVGSIQGVATSTDVPAQGQALAYDAISNKYKARSIEGLNVLINPDFGVWQEFTTYSPTTTAFVADGWKAAATSSGRTVSQTAGIANSKYAMKVQRTLGNATAGGAVRVAQQLSQADSMFLAGRTVILSFDYLVGANYSQTSGPNVSLFYGTGIDEAIDLHVGSPNFATGGATISGGALGTQVAAVGTVARLISATMAVPAGATEIAICIQSGNYVGTAGADDSFTIGNVKLEIGNIATHFRKPLSGDELINCQKRYRKTFLQATAPAQNIGVGNGEFVAAATIAGANVQTLGTFNFGTPMRVAPAATLFNPAAANAQVRDITQSADCSSSTVQNITESACEIIATGNSSTAVGHRLGVHLVLDARL